MQVTRVTVQAQILPVEAHFHLNPQSTPPTVGRKQKDQALPPKVSYEHNANDHRSYSVHFSWLSR